MTMIQPTTFGKTKGSLKRLLEDTEVELDNKNLTYDHSGPLLVDLSKVSLKPKA